MSAWAFLLFAQATPSPQSAGVQVPLQVESNSACPSADEVRHALARTPLTHVAEPLTVLLSVTENVLSLSFRNAAWETVGARRIAVSNECSERAGSAAVVIAAWLNTDGGKPPAAVALAPPKPVQKAPVAARPDSPQPLSRRNEVSVAGGLSVSGSATAAAGVEFSQAFERSGVGWFAGAMGSFPRALDLGAGTSRWARVSLAAGPRARLPVGKLNADMDVGVIATLVSGWGSGYAEDRHGAGLTAGLTSAVRLTVPTQSFALWFEARILSWPGAARVLVDPSSDEAALYATLPASEVLFLVGIRHASGNGS